MKEGTKDSEERMVKEETKDSEGRMVKEGRKEGRKGKKEGREGGGIRSVGKWYVEERREI